MSDVSSISRKAPVVSLGQKPYLIANNWLVPGIDSSVIYISGIACLRMELK